MNELFFHSNLAPYIKAFILQKQAGGYPYVSSSRILGYLDDMICEQFPEEDSLTREICEAWLERNAAFHPNTLLRRVTPVRQLGKYLAGTGAVAYIIPSKIPNRQVRYDPHIFTEQELTAFFAAIDLCPCTPFSGVRSYVIPVIFRLLYTCGMRSSEARTLCTQDIDLETEKIFVRASKGWEAKIIYVSEDLLDLLRRYNTLIETYFPERTAFFPNHKGSFYSKCTLDIWFHEFWDPLPEAKMVKGNPPRVHDFRHTYCVYRLNQWVREGRELNALYPYLSEFVGHSNFADTDYYLTLAEPFYPDLRQRMQPVNKRILPEVHHED